MKLDRVCAIMRLHHLLICDPGALQEVVGICGCFGGCNDIPAPNQDSICVGAADVNADNVATILQIAPLPGKIEFAILLSLPSAIRLNLPA